MFFLLSKVLGFIALPSNAIALVCCLGLGLLVLKRRRAGTSLLTVGIAALLIFGYSPMSNVLLLTLSERFPAWHFDGHEPDGIIILGGAIEAGPSAARNSVEVDGAAERVIAALELARRGLGRVWPNPAVGCVIVKDGRVVGRGWTQPGGRPHAETEALGRAGTLADGATLYTTLEPCSHFGKTPPCADAVIAAGIVRVVAAMEEPDPRVNGAGFTKRRAAGIACSTLAPEAVRIPIAVRPSPSQTSPCIGAFRAS